jgi:heme/copper-type cytochrome/quinol oxidase subunit 2
MWGNIFTEVIVQSNFHIGFSNNKSDILIHLGQWQYWWWFWFAFLWSFYYLVVFRFVRFRTLKFRPRLATTLKPHGKWGDLLVGIIPVSWCANILSNASFLLRMIEWQNEGGLFTVRIRGKQWYWVYKFEVKTFVDILTTPKNIGRNKWCIYTPGDMQTSNDYIHIIQLRLQNRWVKKYWNKYFATESREDNFHLASADEKLRTFFLDHTHMAINKELRDNLTTTPKRGFNYDLVENVTELFDVSDDKILLWDHRSLKYKDTNWYTRLQNKEDNWEDKTISDLKDQYSIQNYQENPFFKSNNMVELYDDLRDDQVEDFDGFDNVTQNIINKNIYENYKSFFYRYQDYNMINRWTKKQAGILYPARLLKNYISDDTKDILDIRFMDNETSIQPKILPHNSYLVFKQKRYLRKKVILPRVRYIRDEFGTIDKGKKIRFSGKLHLHDNTFSYYDFNATARYKRLKKQKVRDELTNVLLSRRLLRTRRTLVLPAHTNLTLITNSFDVIHSWFIPGLGLKLDCIPGRSTHHTFYIDNVGFYYGQCAEICGRYHHHMPIRICALPFEHFLIWWHTFGLPRLMTTRKLKRYTKYYAARKYVW